MTITLPRSVVTTPAASVLRMELIGLVLATIVVTTGVVLTQEAQLRRAAIREGPAQAVIATALTGERTPREFRVHVAEALALMLAAFYGLHAIRRVRRQRGDGVLLPAALTLCGLGLMTMIAVRDPLRGRLLVQPFAGGVCLGSAAAALVSLVNVERLRTFAYLPLLTAAVLSAALLLFGSGPGRSGVKVNLWGTQPVEAIRLLETLFLAGYLGSRWEYLRALRDPHLGRSRLLRWLHVPHLDYLLPLLLCLAATLLFYVAQADLGPALIMACLFLALYAVACRRVGLAIVGLATLVLAFWAGYQLGVPATVGRRVAIWLSPWSNALRGGDQVAHGLWAFASGGAMGRGPGLGDAQVVPAAHTDFVLAAIGEDLGFAGVVSVLGLVAVVIWRALRIAQCAVGDYSRFLALGIALAYALPLTLIAAGTLGLLPLSGVVTPFISYGKSAMTVNLLALGLLLSIANRASARPSASFRLPIRCLTVLLAVSGVVIATRALQVQVLAGDETMVRPVLTVLADGTYRFQDNPRLLAAARDLMPRGTIFDRNHLPLAISGAVDGDRYAGAFAKLGIDLAQACGPDVPRCYPLGGQAFHVIGDARTERDWTASNSSFVERDAARRLRGFDDHAASIVVRRSGGNGTLTLIRRDYSELIPLVRHRYRPGHRDVQRLINRPRDVTLTLDARLQTALAALVREQADRTGFASAAAIVVDVGSRDVLASVSYPWPEPGVEPRGAGLDRVRYGLYPPGSIFKLVTAMAALRHDATDVAREYSCELLPGGRSGKRIRGWSRPVRDDRSEGHPHGTLTLPRALAVSCNAYFAQLAMHLGPEVLRAAAQEFGIALTPTDTRARVRDTLPFAAFGQGDVVTTPARFAQVVETVAAGGLVGPHNWILEPSGPRASSRRVVPRAAAHEIASAMRQVVTSGTARLLASNATAIAGKTGTAEVENGVSHSWFAGFAPYRTDGRRIAFVVLVEHGGYGARAAGPLAGAIVDAARRLRIIH